MFSSILTDFNLLVASHAAVGLAGVVFSTRIKDYFKGIPSTARAALKNVEANLVGDLKAAEAEVLAKLPGIATVAAKVALAPAPAAPAAPAAPTAPAPTAAPAA